MVIKKTQLIRKLKKFKWADRFFNNMNIGTLISYYICIKFEEV